MHTLKQAYDLYTADGGTLPYRKFRDVCELFNKKAVKKLLEGKRIFMKNRLGYLQIIRIPRNYNRPRVNWGESYKYRDELLAEGKKLYDKDSGEGHKWLVYYTDDFFVRFHWSKKNCSVKNKTFYRFDPTRGKVGAKEQLAELLSNDDLAYLNFVESKYV